MNQRFVSWNCFYFIRVTQLQQFIVCGTDCRVSTSARMERLGKRPAEDDSHAKKVSGICPLYGNAMYDMVCVFSGILASACGRLLAPLAEGGRRLRMMGAATGIEAACPVLGRRYVHFCLSVSQSLRL